jgi:hypothetical protein
MVRSVPVAALSFILLLASLALPLQLGSGKAPDAHNASAAESHLVSGSAHGAAHRDAPDDHGDQTHRHEAECFWCVGLVAVPILQTNAPHSDHGVSSEAAPKVALDWRRPWIRDAAPRAPPTLAAISS